MDVHPGAWAPMSRLAPAALLRPDEVMLLNALRRNLPDGWVVDVQAGGGMVWSAAVYCASTLSSGPQFTICGWISCVGLVVHWMDGSAVSAVTFAELEPVVALIPNAIFVGALAHLATVPAVGWTNTRH